MSEPSTSIVDHIVHLSSPGQLKETTKTWHDLGFNVVPGGTHADGLTENALVAFEDGAYIELISFTHPLSYYPPNTPAHEARKNHSWASKQPGFIDFAFLGNAGTPSIATTINTRAEKDGSEVRYAGEVQGGRTRTDGKKLEWLISAPVSEEKEADVRGSLPFFCGDLTPRELRVPHGPSEISHPNAALGIAHIRLLAPSREISHLAKQITTVLGTPPLHPQSEFDADSTAIRWKLDSVRYGNTRNAPILELRAPLSDQEGQWVRERGAGIHQVKVRVKDDTIYIKGGVNTSTSTGDVEFVR